MLRGLHHQVVPLRPALVETAPGLLQLEGVHIGSFVDGPRMEEKMVGGDREQGVNHLRHTGKQKKILKKYCRDHNYTAIRHYDKDDGYWGTNFD